MAKAAATFPAPPAVEQSIRYGNQAEDMIMCSLWRCLFPLLFYLSLLSRLDISNTWVLALENWLFIAVFLKHFFSSSDVKY